MSPTSLPKPGGIAADGAFRSICCGVDGNRAGFQAVRQAAALAQAGSTIRLVAVTWETGSRADAMLRLSRRRADAALDRAREIAHELGIHTDGTIVEGPDAEVKLLDAASGHDLLVVGSSGRSHAGGLVLGHAAGEVLERAPTSVLVARTPHGAFPASMLIAAADEAALARIAPVAAALARHHRADVAILAGRTSHHALAEAITELATATGTEPVVLDAHGRLGTSAGHAAADLGASLIVTAGQDAEQIAEHARCSVLVLRDPRG